MSFFIAVRMRDGNKRILNEHSKKSISLKENSVKNQKKEEFYRLMKETMIRLVPEDLEVWFERITKQNRKGLHACTIVVKGCAAAPTFYFEDLYEAYLNGTAAEDIAESLFRFAKDNSLYSLPGNIDIEDYECVRKNLGLTVIGEERNRDYLKGIIYEKIEDLALLPVIFTNDKSGLGNIKIRKEFLGLWDITEEELIREAKTNAPELMPLTFRQLGRVVGEESEDGEELFVISNEYFAGGAAVVFYPHVLEAMGSALGKDLFLLPSSVNEMIMLTDTGQDSRNLYEIVKEVNRTQVSESELLTDAVYHYDRNADSFCRVQPV